MAHAATKEAEEDEAEKPAAGGGMPSSKILLIGALVLGLLLVIAVGLAAFFALRGSASHQEVAEADSADTAVADQPVAVKGKEKAKGKEKGKEKEKEKKLPAQYIDLAPAFVVNLQDDQAMRYLQIEIQLMARDPKDVEAIRGNMPKIRNTLMLLFAQQHAKDLATREAKEALQQQALEQVQAAMKDETGLPAVEAAYFTTFVVQ